MNFPTRGIGLSTIEKIRSHSVENHTDLFQSSIVIKDSLPSRALEGRESLITIEDWNKSVWFSTEWDLIFSMVDNPMPRVGKFTILSKAILSEVFSVRRTYMFALLRILQIISLSREL